jgi:release factor glutamine methyltransferase
VIGSSCFRDLCLDVGPGVLVPRPETEQLVEWTLKAIPLQARAICDVGTGSGAIALSLAKTRPDWNVVGIDLHAEALQYAVRNQAKLGIGNVHFVQGDLLEPFAADSFDAIITNPPYVKTAEHRELQEEVRCHEPITALVGGDDGLSCIRSIIRDAVRVLRPGGMLGIEIGESQGVAVCDLLRIGGGFQGISIKNDWNGKERFVFCAKRK